MLYYLRSLASVADPNTSTRELEVVQSVARSSSRRRSHAPPHRPPSASRHSRAHATHPATHIPTRAQASLHRCLRSTCNADRSQKIANGPCASLRYSSPTIVAGLFRAADPRRLVTSSTGSRMCASGRLNERPSVQRHRNLSTASLMAKHQRVDRTSSIDPQHESHSVVILHARLQLLRSCAPSICAPFRSTGR